MKRKKLTVQIPPGVSTGTKVHLPGKGEVGYGGGAQGDLYIDIEVAKHKTLKRNGNNLILTINVSMATAALGSTADIELLEGKETVEIPAGTQPGDIITLKGKGMPKLRGSGRGDLKIVFNVSIPKKLSHKEKNLLQEFSKIRLAENKTEKEHEIVNSESTSFFSRLKDAFSGK